MTDKITLAAVGSLTNTTTARNTINSNFSVLQTASNNTLSRNGATPNQMASTLDMNSNKVINLPQALSPTEPIRKQEFDASLKGTFVIPTIVGTANQVAASTVGNVVTLSLPSSVALTGTPTVPTAAPGTNTTQAANTAFVAAAISGLGAGGLPTVDNTLKADGKTLYYDGASTTLKWCWASPADRTADLRDFLDAQNGVGGWTYRSAPGVGTDCRVALENALVALRNRYGYGRVRIAGNGLFRFASQIDSEKLKGMFIEGDNQNSAQLVFDFDSGVAFNYTGAGGYTGGGLRNITMYIESGHPTSTLYGINMAGNSVDQPDGMVFEHVRMTSLSPASSFWYICLQADGSARTAPQGIRIASLNDVQLFCARNVGAIFTNCVQWDVSNFGVYVGSGIGNDCFITGGGTGSTNTTQMDFRRFSISGDLHLNNCQKVSLNGVATNVLTNSTATYIDGFVECPVSGTVGVHSNLVAL